MNVPFHGLNANCFQIAILLYLHFIAWKHEERIKFSKIENTNSIDFWWNQFQRSTTTKSIWFMLRFIFRSVNSHQIHLHMENSHLDFAILCVVMLFTETLLRVVKLFALATWSHFDVHTLWIDGVCQYSGYRASVWFYIR